MAESSWSRRHLGVGTAALCALVAVLGAGAWVTWTAVRWLGDEVDAALPDAAVTEALDRLRDNAQAFANALRRAASVSEPTTEQIRSAAEESDFAVATIGRSSGEMRIWAVGVERRVPSEGTTEDVWVCFAVIIAEPGTAQARVEVSHPEFGCAEPGAPQSLAYATGWLNQRDALATYGQRLAAAAQPAAVDSGDVVDGLRILSRRFDGSTLTVDAADEHGTTVLGVQDTYLYGLRLTVGPSVPGGWQVLPVPFPIALDQATRSRAEADAALLIQTAPGLAGPGSPGASAVALNRGPLIAAIRYEAAEHDVTEHVAVRVVAGGGFGSIPDKPAVLVCYAIVHSGLGTATPSTSASPEPCGYPLVMSA